MAKPLAVLIVEDNNSDAQLIVRLLTKAGYSLTFEQVETAAQMRAALEKQAWEMVISDFSMPELDGHAALKLVQETGLDIPFIVVSGTMGEETAVGMMKAGAHDYVMKGNLARLVPAVERELEQAEARRKRKQAEEALRASDLQHRTILASALDGFWLVDIQGSLLEVNETYCRMSGYSEQELLGLHIPDLESLESAGETASHIQKIIEQGEDRFESRHLRKNGSVYDVEISVQYRAEEGGRFVAFLQDITERKQAETINSLISETQDLLLRPNKIEDIYQLVSEKVRELIGDGITATSMLDEEHQTVRMGSYHGLDVPMEKLISILGIDAYKVISLADMTEEDLRIFRSGRLEYLEGGIYTLVTRMVPKPACLLVEKLLRVKKIYTMGFVHENKHLGGLIILARSDITPFIPAIEQIVEVATIAIERMLAEEALKESNELLSLFMKNSPIYCFIKAVAPSESRNLNISDNFQNMLGIPVSEIVGKTMDELFPADLAAKMTADDWAVVSNAVVLRVDEEFNGRKYSTIKFPITQTGRTLLAGYTIDTTERKQAEEHINYQANLLASVQDAVMGTDMTYHINHWNAAAQNLYGWKADDVLGHPMEEFIQNEYLQGTLEDVLGQITEKGSWKGEVTQNRRDGTRIPILASVSAIKGKEGQTIGFVAVNRDISERKQAEEEILSLARFPSENPGPVLRIALDGKLLYINPAGLSLLPEWHLEVGQAAPPNLRQAALQAMSKETTQVLDLEYGEREYSFYVTPIVAAGYANLYGSDTTERKMMEEQLRDSNELLSMFIKHSPIYAFIKEVTPTESRNLNISDNFQDMLGIPASEIAGKTMAELFPADLAAKMTADDWSVVSSGSVMKLNEGLNGRIYDTIKFPIIQGDKTLLAGYTIDITERRQAEIRLKEYSDHLEEMVTERTLELTEVQEKLIRNERLAVLGQISGSVSHELRNPLGVISNAIYFLKLVQPEANDKVRKYHAMIENEVHTADKIIADLLDFARIKSANREQISVAQVVSHTLERFPVPASVELTLDLPADLPLVFADPRQVEQVLGNLVMNAWQAMATSTATGVEAGGKLSVISNQCSANGEQWVRIHVKDTGTGILPENMKKLFEPLFSNKTTGIGLGLVISKSLAEANDGRIEVESEAGVGSTFTLWLPVVKEESQKSIVES